MNPSSPAAPMQARHHTLVLGRNRQLAPLLRQISVAQRERGAFRGALLLLLLLLLLFEGGMGWAGVGWVGSPHCTPPHLPGCGAAAAAASSQLPTSFLSFKEKTP